MVFKLKVIKENMHRGGVCITDWLRHPSACPHGCAALTSLWGLSGSWLLGWALLWSMVWGWVRNGLLQSAQSAPQGLFHALPSSGPAWETQAAPGLAGPPAAIHPWICFPGPGTSSHCLCLGSRKGHSSLWKGHRFSSRAGVEGSAQDSRFPGRGFVPSSALECLESLCWLAVWERCQPWLCCVCLPCPTAQPRAAHDPVWLWGRAALQWAAVLGLLSQVHIWSVWPCVIMMFVCLFPSFSYFVFRW